MGISMVNEATFIVYFILVLILIAIWDTVWKAIGLWKSGRNNQLAWFIVIFIFNTAGILPIIYIVWFQKRPKPASRNVVRHNPRTVKKRK